jgi:MerR family copper efflux transcriptional regulator
LWRARTRSSAEVKAMAVAHIESIDQKIVELRSMRESLWDLNERCHGDDRPECPILDGLAGTGNITVL